MYTTSYPILRPPPPSPSSTDPSSASYNIVDTISNQILLLRSYSNHLPKNTDPSSASCNIVAQHPILSYDFDPILASATHPPYTITSLAQRPILSYPLYLILRRPYPTPTTTDPSSASYDTKGCPIKKGKKEKEKKEKNPRRFRSGSLFWRRCVSGEDEGKRSVHGENSFLKAKLGDDARGNSGRYQISRAFEGRRKTKAHRLFVSRSLVGVRNRSLMQGIGLDWFLGKTDRREGGKLQGINFLSMRKALLFIQWCYKIRIMTKRMRMIIMMMMKFITVTAVALTVSKRNSKNK